MTQVLGQAMKGSITVGQRVEFVAGNVNAGLGEAEQWDDGLS